MRSSGEWHLRGYGSWYMKSIRESQKTYGKTIARVWLSGTKWHWSTDKKQSSAGCKDAGKAKSSARRALKTEGVEFVG